MANFKLNLTSSYVKARMWFRVAPSGAVAGLISPRDENPQSIRFTSECDGVAIDYTSQWDIEWNWDLAETICVSVRWECLATTMDAAYIELCFSTEKTISTENISAAYRQDERGQ